MSCVAARRQLERLAMLGALVIMTATVLAQFARAGWFAELFSHFRPQYLLAALTLACIFALAGRRSLALALLVCAMWNAWYVGPYLLPIIVPPSIAQTTGRDVSIVSLNLRYRNRQYPVVLDYLRRSDADVVVLSELTPQWVEELRPVTGRYPYWISMDRTSPWGLGAFSRYPLLDAQVTNLGNRDSVNVVATVALPEGKVQLVAVHLASPTDPSRAAIRNRELAALATLLERSDSGSERVPRLLVGDLNLTPFSPYFTDLLAQTGMQDARRIHGFHGTWPTWMPPLQIAIDHCIADPALNVTRVARGPYVGSDHYPLEITLRQRG